MGGDTNSAPFTGIYNGNGYTISNLTINSMTNGRYFGLFGKIGYGALLTGIHLRDVKIKGDVDWNVGALTGQVDPGATVTLCSAKGIIDVRGREAIYGGGLVGYSYGAITRCRTDVVVTVDATLEGQLSASAGGITGSNGYGGLLFACHATGSVTLTGRYGDTAKGNTLYAGGITGNNSGDLSSFVNIYCCIAEGNVSATAETAGIDVFAGGLAGHQLNGYIGSSYACGTAVAKCEETSATPVIAGAIVGRYGGNKGNIKLCYGTGEGGKGTSNLDADGDNIVYNKNPAADDIYKIITGSAITVNDVPFTTYNPAATPAYGVSTVKKDVSTSDFWRKNDGIYPPLNFLRNE